MPLSFRTPSVSFVDCSIKRLHASLCVHVSRPGVHQQMQAQSARVKELCVESMRNAGRVKVLTEYYKQMPNGSVQEVKPLLEPEKPLPMPQADVAPVQGMGQSPLPYWG